MKVTKLHKVTGESYTFIKLKEGDFMAKYKKRPDGRYATSAIIGYDENGKPKRKTIYGRTIMELDKKVADFKSLQNKGIVIDDGGLTVQQWSEKWLELYKADKAYNTYMMYKRTVDNHITPNLGSIRLSALKKHQIQELLNNIVQNGHLRTAELVKLTLHQIIQQAIIEEYVYKDVTVGLSLPKAQKAEKRALTDAEKALIQNADLNPKERAFIDLLYYTGIRRGEALALMVSDIDFVNRKISINKNLVMKETLSEVKLSPKTKSGNRQIPMPDKLFQSLKNYMAHTSNIYLFTMQSGEFMTKSAFRRFWDNILDKMNIAAGGNKYKRKDTLKNCSIKPIRLIAKDITPHMFRHTYATNLYYAGIDIKTAQTLLGHSSIQMTMDIYTHLDENKIIDAGEKLNEFFS